jgi:putative hydrolase of the HAD superfamily
MERQHIIFNLDDTLIECNKYYNKVIEQFINDMTKWFAGAKRDEVRQKQLDIDMLQVDKNGLTTEHFPESFVKTYQLYCEERGIRPEYHTIAYLRALGNSVFDMPVEPLPDMYETLEALRSQGHELYLHTGGVEENQRRKVAQLELAAFFDNRIFISLHKDTKALQKIVDEMAFDVRNTWMVGNSPKTDIVPGLELGVNTIFIPAQKEWSYNVVDIRIKPKGAYLTLRRLRDVPRAIEEYLEGRESGGWNHASMERENRDSAFI